MFLCRENCRTSSSVRLTLVRGVPLAGEALGFGELVGGHPAFNSVEIPDGVPSLRIGRS